MLKVWIDIRLTHRLRADTKKLVLCAILSSKFNPRFSIRRVLNQKLEINVEI